MNCKDGRLISQNKHLIGVGMPASFIEEGEEIKLKRHLSCKIRGNVFISSFLKPFIGRQGEGNGNPLQYFSGKFHGQKEPGNLLSMGSEKSGT